MGFPEEIGRAQRDEIQGDLIDAKRLVNTTVENLREVAPHNVALNREEYDLMISHLVEAQKQITLALDQIDSSLVRQAREHDEGELTKAEEEG